MKTQLKLLLLSTSLVSLSVFCVEDMQKITRWDEVSPYAGKVVIFSAKNYYYTKGEHGYELYQGKESGLRAGLIENTPSTWQAAGRGYGMGTLLKANAVPSNHALAGDLLIENDFHMREASSEEKKLILAAIDKKEAELDYMSVGGLEERFRKALQA